MIWFLLKTAQLNEPCCFLRIVKKHLVNGMLCPSSVPEEEKCDVTEWLQTISVLLMPPFAAQMIQTFVSKLDYAWMVAGQTFTGTAHRRTSRWSGIYLHTQHPAVKLKVREWTNPKWPAFQLCLFNLCPSMPFPLGPLCTVASAAWPNSPWSRQTVRQANLQLRPPPVKLDLALMPGPAIVVPLCSLRPMYSHQNTSQPCSGETLLQPWTHLNLLSWDQLSL